ncbi:MAG: L-2-amino-thiazoline-4-carboxylic acid hydrolase [Solobacterium sp.]|nr:L-2-amino-thiazoline-4-carboxylic acid hydrolase [Solobacterium sp.]
MKISQQLKRFFQKDTSLTIPKSYEKALRKMVEQRFPDETESIMRKAQFQYEGFRKETPDIGGKKNMQYKDLDFMMAFFAVYEACDHRVGVEEFESYAYEVMVKPAEKTGKILGWNHPLMKPMAERMYARYKKTIDFHVERGEWGNTWRVELNPEQHPQGFAIHTHMCPNVDFCNAHGYEAFLPVICAQDYRIAKAMHGVLIRTHTVARGDDYCDWWYFGDREELSEEAKRRMKGDLV